MKKPKAIIDSFLQRVTTGANPCGAVSLHLGHSKTEPLVKRRTKQDDATIDIDALGREFLEIISDDDDGTYCLKTWFYDDESNSFSAPGEVSKPIQVKQVDNTQQLLIDMLRQAQNHNETLMGYVSTMVESTSRSSHRQADAAGRIIGELGDVRLRMITAEQENLDRSHERLLETKRDERNAAMIQSAVTGLTNILPMFAGKLTGILPQGAAAIKASPQYQAIKGLFEDIPPDQWPAVKQWLHFAPLPVAQKATLDMVIESLMNDMVELENGNGKKEPVTEGN